MFLKKYRVNIVVFIVILILAFVSINTAALEVDKNLQIKEEKLEILHPVYVEKVIDGDTFKIEGNRRVRLLGIDTPEIKNKNKGEIDLDYGDEAREYADKRLEGKKVYMEYDVRKKDKFGRILAYVFLDDGTFFNAELLAEGYAHLLTIAPDVKYVDLFKKLAREAKVNERGLWGKYREQTEDLPIISWQEAEEFIGKRVVVKGTVMDTYDSGKAVFLNFDMEYWHTFTAVIFAGDKCKFAVDPEKYYLNKEIKVTGEIELYEDAPEIIVYHPVQIRILD